MSGEMQEFVDWLQVPGWKVYARCAEGPKGQIIEFGQSFTREEAIREVCWWIERGHW